MKRPSEQKESLLSNLENDWVAQNPMRMRLLWQTAGASNSRSKATFLGHTEQSCLFASKTGSRCVSLVALRWTSVFSLPSTKITSIYHLAHLWTAPKHIDMFLPCINSNSRRPQRQTKWVQGRFFPLTHIMGKAVSQVMLHAIKFRISEMIIFLRNNLYTMKINYIDLLFHILISQVWEAQESYSVDPTFSSSPRSFSMSCCLYWGPTLAEGASPAIRSSSQKSFRRAL